MARPYLSAHQRALLRAARRKELMAYRTVLGTITLVAGADTRIRPLGLRLAIQAGHITIGEKDTETEKTAGGAWYKVLITVRGDEVLEAVEEEYKARQNAKRRIV